MCSPFVGKFKLVDSENFDEYMKAVGVSMPMRLAAKTANPTQEISVDENTYTFKTISTFKTHELKFTLGEEFDDETIDGRKAKAVVTKEGDNKLVHIQHTQPEGKITREIDGDMYTMTLEASGVTAVRKYKRC